LLMLPKNLAALYPGVLALRYTCRRNMLSPTAPNGCCA